MKITVTGAAGGIGLATVQLAIEYGHKVIAVDLPIADFSTLQHENVEIILADLSKQSDRDKVVEASGGVEGLVNCAGAMIMKPIFEFTMDEIHKLFEINFESTWDLTSRIGSKMPDGGSIVNLSSTGSKYVSNSQVGPYAATKAAINSLTRTFAFEFAQKNVRVNAVAPGIINTPMQDKVLKELNLQVKVTKEFRQNAFSVINQYTLPKQAELRGNLNRTSPAFKLRGSPSPPATLVQAQECPPCFPGRRGC